MEQPPWDPSYSAVMMFIEPIIDNFLGSFRKRERQSDWDGIVRMIDVEKFTDDLIVFLRTFIPHDKGLSRSSVLRFVKFCKGCCLEFLSEVQEEKPSFRRLWRRCKVYWDRMPSDLIEQTPTQEVDIEPRVLTHCNSSCPCHC